MQEGLTASRLFPKWKRALWGSGCGNRQTLRTGNRVSSGFLRHLRDTLCALFGGDRVGQLEVSREDKKGSQVQPEPPQRGCHNAEAGHRQHPFPPPHTLLVQEASLWSPAGDTSSLGSVSHRLSIHHLSEVKIMSAFGKL